MVRTGLLTTSIFGILLFTLPAKALDWVEIGSSYPDRSGIVTRAYVDSDSVVSNNSYVSFSIQYVDFKNNQAVSRLTKRITGNCASGRYTDQRGRTDRATAGTIFASAFQYACDLASGGSSSTPSASYSTPPSLTRTDSYAPIRQPYTGSCECPYDFDIRGYQCGGRSAWSRPGGAEPICYDSDY